eukprot:3381126-Ditylum_brightwellii.AAC.1
MFENDFQPCECSIDAHAVQMNELMENKDFRKRKILFVFPDGVECSVNYKDTAPLEDENISPVLCVIKRTNITLNGSRNKFSHLFLPMNWKLCIVDRCHKILQHEEKVECDLFVELSKGMKDMEVG